MLDSGCPLPDLTSFREATPKLRIRSPQWNRNWKRNRDGNRNRDRNGNRDSNGNRDRNGNMDRNT